MLKHLIDQKIMGREKNAMANLAAYLSAWKNEFVSDGKGNFSLRAIERSTGNEVELSH